MIIRRYLAREIIRPFLAIVGLLSVVFASYSTTVVLDSVVAGLLPAETVVRFVLIKSLIALEVLTPVALFLGVTIGLGRLHNDGEMVAMAACGISELSVLITVFRLAVAIAVLVAFLSMYVRPWAYLQRYQLLAVAETELDVGIKDLEGGRFYVSPDSDYAIFADTIDPRKRRAESVFFSVSSDRGLQIVSAEELYQPRRTPTEPLTLVFLRGHAYHLDREGSRDILLTFKRLVLHLRGPEAEDIGYKSKTQSTAALSRSSDRKDLAEYQWRLSTPVATLLLALLAALLSRAPPRRGRYAKTVLALLGYAVFYNLMSMAKNLVQEGIVGAVPGLWWPLALLAMLIVSMAMWPRLRRRPRHPRCGRHQ